MLKILVSQRFFSDSLSKLTGFSNSFASCLLYPLFMLFENMLNDKNFFKPGNDVNYLIETFPLNTAI